MINNDSDDFDDSFYILINMRKEKLKIIIQAGERNLVSLNNTHDYDHDDFDALVSNTNYNKRKNT